MTAKVMRGRAWVFGDDVDTDAIAPSRYLAVPDPAHWAAHVMEPLAPGFAARLAPGDLIVAGENFGCGSSREHAAVGLKVAGVGAIVAKSVARIFFRNALNNGLAAVECPEACDVTLPGDELSVDLARGEVVNHTQNQSFHFRPLPASLLTMLRAGGLESYLLGGGKFE